MAKIARHTPTLSDVIKIRALSIDSALIPHISDAITQLSHDWHWTEVGDSVDDIVQAVKLSVENWYSDMLIGSVSTWLINPPAGWLLLDGSTYASADYPELSALLPTHLISGANFTLPDTEDAFPFSVLDEGDGAVVAGNNVLTLSVAQLPAHTHTEIPAIPAGSAGGAGPPIPTTGVGSPVATSSVGSGDDIDKRPLRFGLVYAVYAGRE